MNLLEIKKAVDNGQTVKWSNCLYTVIKGKAGYIIACENGTGIGLTWLDGVTLNGKESEFYIQDAQK